MPLLDQDLPARAQQGDENALAALIARMMPAIRKGAAECTAPGLDFDDAVQEGLIGLYDAALTYDPNGAASFKTYAGVCISNRFTSVLRKQTGLKNKPLNDFVSIFDESGAAQLPAQEFEAAVLFREMLAGVLSQVKSLLSQREQKVLGLYLRGYNRKEIARSLSLSLKSVDNTMQRIRKKLKHHRNDV